MTDFFQDHPLLILAVLIGNCLWISLLCYCGLKYWIVKRYCSSNDVAVVTQYIIESPANRTTGRPQEPFSGVRNIVIVERSSLASTPSSCSELPPVISIPDEPPPNYFDIFPNKEASKAGESIQSA